MSSPEESHLQALSEPDMNLSAHPAPIIRPTTTGFVLSIGSSHFWLTNFQNWMTQPLRSIPITEASSLLRAVPPLCSASVLSSSWDLHLDFSLSIRTTGSHVPHESQNHVHATFMPDAARAINRHPPNLSWDGNSSQF